MAMRDYLVGEVAEEYAHGLLDRREAVRRLGLLGVGAAAATSLLAACAEDSGAGAKGAPPAPVPSPTPTPSLTPPQATPPPGADVGELVSYSANGVTYRAAWKGATGTAKGALLVIHENKGLTTHFFELVGRFAKIGYAALCVDLLSRTGPNGLAGFTDQAAATAALSGIPKDDLLTDLRAAGDELLRRAGDLKLGAIGFCFGGAMTWSLLQAGPLQEERLRAAVPFYGPAPDVPDFTGSPAAVLGMYAANDARVNATRDAATAALQKAGLTHEVVTYDGVEHAFFNDTGPRFNAVAADQAWAKVQSWFGTHLA
ncbi:MAG: dienelactone hydrolase family protein [Sporichthyaceae bacterium]